MNRITAVIAAIALLLASPAGAAVGKADAIPRLYKNCTNLNKRYPHGLGKANARDRTTGTPVTNFRRSTRLYNRAMSYNVSTATKTR